MLRVGLLGALLLCSTPPSTSHGVTLSDLVSWVPSVQEVLQYNGSSDGCVSQTTQLLRRAHYLDLQALHVLDSWAKLPSGLLSGNINQLGDYDQCASAGGRYCLATLDLRLPAPLAHLDSLAHAHYAMTSSLTDSGHRLPKFSLVHWGVCMPASCSPADTQQALAHALRARSVTAQVRVDHDLCSCRGDPPLPSSFAYPAWCMFMSIFLLCVCGTVLDVYKGRHPDKPIGRLRQVAEAFSVHRNVRCLLDTRTGHGDIPSVHGVRALNALALLLSHKQMALLFLPFINRTRLAQLIGRSWSMIGRSAILYTDSFILLSGLLTCQTLLRELSRSHKINLWKYVLSRLIRLTPSLGTLVVFCTLVLPSLGSGPLWPLLINKYASLCQQHWWRNLLYIHNLFPFHEMCLTHSHQVAIDTQLFLVAPLLVYPLWRWPRAGTALLLTVATWSSLLRYSVALSQRLSTVIYFGVPISQLFRTAELTYVLPSHRATVYCLGIALGYRLHYRHSCSLSPVSVVLGWVTAVACGLVAMFGFYHMSWMSYVYSPQEAALYNALAPILWSLFVGWVVFSSYYGYAGWFGRLLSWRWFTVFTRLSYAVYLTQFPIFFYNVGQVRTGQQYTLFKLLDVSEFLCVLVASAVLTVLSDLPAQNLKKAFLSSTKDIKKTMINEEYTIEKAEAITKRMQQVQRRKRLPG